MRWLGLILLPFACLGDVDTKDGAAINRATNMDGATANFIRADGQTIKSAVSPPTYIIQENCEGTGKPSGWTDSSSAPDWDESVVVLEGTQSLKCDGTSQTQSSYYALTEIDQLYAHFRFQYSAAPSASKAVCQFQNGTTQLGVLYITSTGKLGVRAMTGTIVYTADTLTASTTYYIWVDYTKSTGSNDGLMNVYYSTTGTKPGSPDATSSNGTNTSQINRFYLMAQTPLPSVYFDRILADDVPVGSDP